jgi:hypothetical protein
VRAHLIGLGLVHDAFGIEDKSAVALDVERCVTVMMSASGILSTSGRELRGP